VRFASILLLLSTGFAAAPDFVTTVRAAIAQKNFTLASQLLNSYQASRGMTLEWLSALSWMARGELSAKDYDLAEKYASETYQLSTGALQHRGLDQEPILPLALGAAIEVEANVLAARNQRGEAVSYLKDQLKTYQATSIGTRLQKNLNLLTMEGKPAPALESVALPKGKPVLVFFWAHWCMDCKAEAPILARIKAEFARQGLVLVAPTQRYGYVAGGQDAPPEVEDRYIEKIRQERYGDIITSPAPISGANFLRYGASTTPTLVLIDRAGIVRLYHPGGMTYEELRPLVARICRTAAMSARADPAAEFLDKDQKSSRAPTHTAPIARGT